MSRPMFVVFWLTLMLAYGGIATSALLLGGRDWSTIALSVGGVWAINAIFLLIALRRMP